MRSIFADIEQKAKNLTECENYQREHKRNHDAFGNSSTLDTLVESQKPSQVKSRTFLVIIDRERIADDKEATESRVPLG